MPNTEKLVTIGRLNALLDAYGAAPECWPEEERAAAAALIETSPEARMLVEEAVTLDALLDKIPEPEVSAALMSRVRSMALPIVAVKSDGPFARLADLLRPQTPRAWRGAVAMAAVLGMVAGVGLSTLMLDRTDPIPRVVATGSPVTNVTAFIASDVATVSDGVEAVAASLAPSVNAISLTGDDMAENSSDSTGDTANNNDAGEFTVAGVPLY